MKFKYYLRGAGIGVITATIILAIAFLFHKDTMSDAEVIERALELGMVMEEHTDKGTLGEMSDTKTEDGSKTEADDSGDGASAPDKSSADTSKADTKTDDAADADGKQDAVSGKVDKADGTSAADADKDTASETDKKTDNDTPKTPEKNNTEKADTSKKDTSKDKADTGKKHTSKDSASKDDTTKTDKNDTASKTDGQVTITIQAGDVSRDVSRKVYESGLVDDAEKFNSYLGANDYDNLLQPGTYKIKKGSTFEQIAVTLTTRR